MRCLSVSFELTGVGVGQQGADGQQDFRDGQGGRPLFLEHVLLKKNGDDDDEKTASARLGARPIPHFVYLSLSPFHTRQMAPLELMLQW